MPEIKIKVEALSEPFNAKSGKGFIRKYLTSNGRGGREVITVYSKDAASLPEVGEIVVATGDFLFAR